MDEVNLEGTVDNVSRFIRKARREGEMPQADSDADFPAHILYHVRSPEEKMNRHLHHARRCRKKQCADSSDPSSRNPETNRSNSHFVRSFPAAEAVQSTIRARRTSKYHGNR